MGRQPRISREAVLAAGLAVADEEGLAAVTMQAVARRLEVTPMALYRHVANKDDLLDGLVEALLTEIEPPPPDAPWDERLDHVARGVRAAAARHPGVFPLLLQRPAATPGALRVREGVHSALRDAGVHPKDVERAERLLSTAVLGYAASEAAGRFAHHSQRVRDEDFACLLTTLRTTITKSGEGNS